jgi:antitoxin CptB
MQPGQTMTDDLDMLRRRASYRAHHRGTKEMDVLMGRYADARLPAFSPKELARFETFLSLPDPMLQAWVFSDRAEGGEFHDLIADMRVFHRLADETN